TYADLLVLPEGERWELLDGEAYMMGQPTTAHQRALGDLFYQLYAFLKGKPCEAFPAPFGVRLFPKADKSDDTVFEPDIVVVCDASKISDRGCNGAPDLVIEILSPSTATNDLLSKFNKYHDAGVREYWIVDIDKRSVAVYHFEKNGFLPAIHTVNEDGALAVNVLPGCTVDLKAVFAERP
ncbi:MAG: Uma2 family endonuclease, partial [Spirochaetaceae bacterium]|nr:Uma2 family endonuclease [Spirochaetaceae bacterium]